MEKYCALLSIIVSNIKFLCILVTDTSMIYTNANDLCYCDGLE